MTTNMDFPAPSLIVLTGIELAVFEAGQENKGNLQVRALPGLPRPVLAVKAVFGR